MDGKDQDISSFFRSIPNITQLSPRAHILLVAYYISNHSRVPEFSSLILKNAFIKARLPYNHEKVSSLLKELSTGDKDPLMQKTKNKYLISIFGDEEVKIYLKNKPQIETGVSILNDLLGKVKDNNQRLFLREAISCGENRAYRASIIMTWLFIVDHLQKYVIKHKLAKFNKAMSVRPDCKKLSAITNSEDFASLKEATFIEILKSANIVTKGVKKVLIAKLDTRNTCAHPSNIIIKESSVVEFIDTLIENVF